MNQTLQEAFESASRNQAIVESRYAMLDTVTKSLPLTAEKIDIYGHVAREDESRATALLLSILAELSGSMAILIRHENHYAASALLRQIVEVEYLLFMGYADPKSLGEWLTATNDERRKLFTPAKMRKVSQGLFRDEEYWVHCEVGGHPNPRATMMLSGYAHRVSPLMFLLPDTVHHLRRAMTSASLLLPKLGGDIHLELSITDAISHWEQTEDKTILSYDGIAA